MIYEAFFIQENLESTLEKEVINKHITTSFRPKNTHKELYGKEAIFNIVGYGNNNVNEGFKVELVSCEDERLRELFNNINIPHITLSISKMDKAVDTAKLDFNPVDTVQTVTGKFGGFDGSIKF